MDKPYRYSMSRQERKYKNAKQEYTEKKEGTGIIVMLIHTFREGDTLFKIARQYAVSPTRLLEDNAITEPDRITPGRRILISGATRRYTVRGGDSIESVCKRFGIGPGALCRMNPALCGTDSMYPGQVLTLSTPTPIGTLAVLGHGDSETDRTALRQIMPYLSYFAIGGAVLHDDGTLTMPRDKELLSFCSRYEAEPLLTVSLLDFVPAEVTVRQLISGLRHDLTQRRYGGVLLRLPALADEEGEAFRELIGGIKSTLNRIGLCVFTECEEGAFVSSRTLRLLCSVFAEGMVLSYDSRARSIQERMADLRHLPGRERGRVFAALPYFGVDRIRSAKEEEIRYLPLPAIPDIAYRKHTAISQQPDGMAAFSYQEIHGGVRRTHQITYEDPEAIREGLQEINRTAIGGVSLEVGHTTVETLLMLVELFSFARREIRRYKL